MRLSNIQNNLHLTADYRGKFEQGHRPDGTKGFNRTDFQQVMGINDTQRKHIEEEKAKRQSKRTPQVAANKNAARTQNPQARVQNQQTRAQNPQGAYKTKPTSSKTAPKTQTKPHHKSKSKKQPTIDIIDIYKNNRMVRITSGVLAGTVAVGGIGYAAGNANGYNRGLEAGEKSAYTQAYDESSRKYETEMDAAINAAIDEYKAEVNQTYIEDPMVGISEAADIPLSLLKLANNYKANGDAKENLNLASTVVPHEKTTFPYRVASEELFVGHQEERQLLAQAQENLARVFSDGDEFSDNGFIYLTANRDTTMGELKSVFGIVDGALARAKVNGLEPGVRSYVGNSYEKDGAIVPKGDTIRVKINDNNNAACPGLQFGVYKNHKDSSADVAQLETIKNCALNIVE